MSVDLEPTQLVAYTAKAVDRAMLTPRVRLALWGLRVFTVVLAALVASAFILNLN